MFFFINLLPSPPLALQPSLAQLLCCILGLSIDLTSAEKEKPPAGALAPTGGLSVVVVVLRGNGCIPSKGALLAGSQTLTATGLVLLLQSTDQLRIGRSDERVEHHPQTLHSLRALRIRIAAVGVLGSELELLEQLQYEHRGCGCDAVGLTAAITSSLVLLSQG
ncbi:hypothetical protein PYV02_01385 [Leifsonia sp. H3M29-4]|uniref:hypothetical protein n=1 Tax=Salinibacterium metalliresistens TaxID=3031321 RepID=UPI0023D9FEC0|nr:hypothetical protein [Salinibacterium metalliresistens]MDF1477731.1 hypothetical protein [Salinibacterium metalliresistens]